MLLTKWRIRLIGNEVGSQFILPQGLDLQCIIFMRHITIVILCYVKVDVIPKVMILNQLSFVSINEYNFTSLSPSMSSSFSFFLSFSYSFSLISFCKYEQCWILLINSLVTLSVCLFQTLSVCSAFLSSHTIHSLL